MSLEKDRAIGIFDILSILMNEKQNLDNTHKNETEMAEKKDAASSSSRTYLQSRLTRFQDNDYNVIEPFSIKRVKKGLVRICTVVAPWLLCLHNLNSIYHWDNKLVTACLANFYFIIWYHDLLLTFFIGWIVISLVLIRVDMSLDVAFDHPKLPWRKWMVKQAAVPFDYQTFIEEYGPLIQNLIMKMADYLERFKNLFSWKNPIQTSIILAGMLLSTLVSIQFIAKMFLLYIGIEFFVLHALRCHYPKYQRLFNVLEWLLLDIPADHHDNNDKKKVLTVKNRENTGIRAISTQEKTDTTNTSNKKSTMVFLASANFTHKLLCSNHNKKKIKVDNRLLKTNDPNVFGCVYRNHPGFLRLEEGNGFTFMTNQKRLVAVAWQDVVNIIKKDRKGISVSIKDGVLLTFEPVINRDACFSQLVKNLSST
ncbi:hypothetical protein K501DRAFT_274188 [Backusella circina FSU 941]|nr:hypothetical protein K501DRAFT_274188 [Backusella circina FSU 941]